LPAWLVRAPGFRVGHVERVVPGDEQPTRATEISPFRDEAAFLIEDLNAVVAAVGDEQPALRIERQVVWTHQLARAAAFLADNLDQLAVLGKLHDARVAVGRRMTLPYENVAIGRDRDRGRLIEDV